MFPNYWGRDQGGIGGCRTHFSPLNVTKIYLVEQSSLKPTRLRKTPYQIRIQSISNKKINRIRGNNR